MINEHSSGFGIILATTITICFIISVTAAAEEATSGESKGAVIKNSKRAWNQMAGTGWGKRAENDLNDEEFYELIHRLLLKYNADKMNDDENDFNADFDNAIDKRAWSQMAGTGWGKRDWRGYGKRREWSKLQSAWGKKK